MSASDQAWLLNEVATLLRALGRLTEAVEPMRVAMNSVVADRDWNRAAGSASNLSELEVTLGRLQYAVTHGRCAIEFADLGRKTFQKIVTRASTADALHQIGDRREAEKLFAAAEQMQAERQPYFPLLYSQPGFHYADLVLAAAERAAWRVVLAYMDFQQADRNHEQDGPVRVYAVVERRAEETLDWATKNPGASLLDIALHHLTLARARLYRALLSAASATQVAGPQFEITTALTKLRQANSVSHLPNALLTSGLHAATFAGQPDEARRFLDEAELIAERGPMPLYLADVHLHRARLFRDRTELAEARKLIERHGYWRRKEELEDAEAASGVERTVPWPITGTPSGSSSPALQTSSRNPTRRLPTCAANWITT